MCANKQIDKAEAEYYILASNEKAHHKAELHKLRKSYEDCRKEFYDYEKAIDAEKPTGQDEEQDERDELLKGIDELDRQEGEINNIIKMGYEANDMQKNAGRNLRTQRDVIARSAKNTNAAHHALRKANQKIELISLRNMLYTGSLYGIAIVLFLIIICILVLKIKNI